jgi:tetratricopeptide (TPR) repeat protein
MGPTLLGLDHVRACTGRYGEAWTGLQETLRELKNLNQVRYQLIAYDFMGDLLLDVGANELAIEHLERGLALGQDSGILFWRATLETHLAVARSRLGERGIAAPLESALEQSRRDCERYMAMHCLEGLAEIALAAGDTRRCREYADELLALAKANGLREVEACARRWRGEAWLAEQALTQAQAELTQAATQAIAIGRVRLQRDLKSALAQLSRAQGDSDAARQHETAARTIDAAIAASMESSTARGFR